MPVPMTGYYGYKKAGLLFSGSGKATLWCGMCYTALLQQIKQIGPRLDLNWNHILAQLYPLCPPALLYWFFLKNSPWMNHMHPNPCLTFCFSASQAPEQRQRFRGTFRNLAVCCVTYYNSKLFDTSTLFLLNTSLHWNGLEDKSKNV